MSNTHKKGNYYCNCNKPCTQPGFPKLKVNNEVCEYCGHYALFVKAEEEINKVQKIDNVLGIPLTGIGEKL